MAVPTTRVFESLAFFWHKLPVIAGGMQRKIQYADVLSFLAPLFGWLGRSRDGVFPAASSDKLASPMVLVSTLPSGSWGAKRS